MQGGPRAISYELWVYQRASKVLRQSVCNDLFVPQGQTNCLAPGGQTFLSDLKFFRTQRFSGPKIFVRPKILWTLKFLWVHKFYEPKKVA